MSRTHSERWAAHIARGPQAIQWALVIVWIPIILLNLWNHGVLVGGFLVLFWVMFVSNLIIFDGFRWLPATKDRQIEELKSSLENMPSPSRPDGM
jgi:hypothetical protein